MSVKVKFEMHEGGFFSNFNKVITFLNHFEKINDISEVEWNLIGQPFGAFAYNLPEVFGTVFEQYKNGKHKEETTVSEYLQLSLNKYTGKNAHNLYIGPDHWRKDLNKTFLKYIKTTKEAQHYIDKANENKKNCKGKIISILKRNQRLRCEQPSDEMPTLEQYFEKIDELFDDETYLYLCVDNMNDLNAFIKRYKRCLYHPYMRRTTSDKDQEPHFIPKSEKDAIHTFVDLWTASQSDYFIHPVSNMATSALYFNPQVESIYI